MVIWNIPSFAKAQEKAVNYKLVNSIEISVNCLGEAASLVVKLHQIIIVVDSYVQMHIHTVKQKQSLSLRHTRYLVVPWWIQLLEAYNNYPCQEKTWLKQISRCSELRTPLFQNTHDNQWQSTGASHNSVYHVAYSEFYKMVTWWVCGTVSIRSPRSQDCGVLGIESTLLRAQALVIPILVVPIRWDILPLGV